jgi:hypothetical protein
VNELHRGRRLPGLTVRQPYAWAALHGGMDVLNMTWYTYRRDQFWLHAGDRARVNVKGLTDPLVLETWGEHFVPGYVPQLRARSPLLVSGAIVALAEVTGCHDPRECGGGPWATRCSPWGKPNYWHWELGRVQELAEPVGCRGWLVWGRVPRSVSVQARENLPC